MAESTSDAHYHRVEKSSDEGCSNWRLLRRAVHQASVSDAARDVLLRKSDRPWTPELVRRSKGEPPPLLRAMTANFVLRRTTYERAVAESGLTCQGLLVSVGPLQALTARALAIGLVCGVVSAAYKAVMDACLHFVWPTLGPLVMSALGLSPPFYILIAGTLLSTANGVALRVLGEPTNNLPEVVVQIHSDGQLDSSPREFLSMTVVSLFTICSGASFGPEAPLIAIGGGLASLAAERFALPKAEVLVLTLCGMGAGLAAFFGQPIGGALFACEVIHSHGLEYFEALIPAVSAAVACNFAFRVVSHLPGGGAVWAFPAEPALAASTALLGAPLGLIGGALGVGWMAAVTRLRGGLTTRGVMKHHVAKGAVAGLVIGTIGICLPETLFWAEARTHTQTHTPHHTTSSHVYFTLAFRRRLRRSSTAAKRNSSTRGPLLACLGATTISPAPPCSWRSALASCSPSARRCSAGTAAASYSPSSSPASPSASRWPSGPRTSPM